MRHLLTLFLIFIFIPTIHASEEAESVPPSSSPQAKAFQERVQKMNKLDERVKSHEESFRALVLKKRKAATSAEKLKAIEEMKEAYAVYEKDMNELVAVKKDLKYRFPSEGAVINRNYAHVEKKSPEELEKTVDLGATLSNTKLAVEEKYKSFIPPKPPSPKDIEKKSEAARKKEKTRLRLER